MRKKGKVFPILPLALIIALYLLEFFLKNPGVFSYKFTPLLLDRYLCSQDIPYEPPCKRLFLSDGDIHIAAGYLYAKGADPTTYNFQHPPLIKYLYGYSILLVDNPYLGQIGLGIIFLFLTYILSFGIFKKTQVSFLSCLFLVTDPLFLNLSADALLDLGQGVFLLLYFLSVLFYKKNFLLQGIALGLLFASKFWGGSLFFFLALAFYLLYKRQFNLKWYLAHFGIAVIVFSLIYIKTFINKGGFFNIVFFELKTLKYWLNHSVASIFGSSVFLFLTGCFKSWWGNKTTIRADTWSIVWPIVFVVALLKSITLFLKKTINLKFLTALVPVAYLFYLGIQAPFARYYILVLPFFYMVFADLIVGKISKYFRARW